MITRPPARLEASPDDGLDIRRTLTKPSDGVISRLLNRRISIPISRQLARTSITPNQISFINLGIGVLAAGLAATGEYRHLVWSGLLFQLGSILDGCDGEVAKLTGQATPQGAWIDTLTDNLSYVAYCVGVTIGLYHRVGSPYVLATGSFATLSVVASLSLMYICLARHSASGSLLRFGDAAMQQARQGRGSVFHRLISRVEFMIRRDFFALLFFVLAVCDRLDWIFWLLVAGSSGLLVSVLATYRQVCDDLSG